MYIDETITIKPVVFNIEGFPITLVERILNNARNPINGPIWKRESSNTILLLGIS